MAVSPFRALLAMHFQSGWNRSVKELGKQGAWALVLLSGLIIGFAVLPTVAGLGAAGWVLGRALDQPWGPAALGGLAAALGLGGGLVNGVLGGTRVLAWERLRGFPLRLPTLFFAELVAGIGDLLPLLLSLGLVSMGLGLVLARPAAAPLALLFIVESVGLLLVTQLLVGGLAEALMKRLRLLLFVAGGLIWGVSVLSSTLATDTDAKTNRKPPSRAAQQAQSVEQARLRQQIISAGHRLQLISEPLPTTQAAHAVLEAAQGRWGLALLRHLYPLALLALLGTAAARVLQREAASGSLPSPAKGPEKLWSFRSPAAGIARLQWHTLVGSAFGRFGLVVPLMAVVILRGPFARMKGQAHWTIPVGFAYLALTASQLLFNQFGLDGPAARGLLLLPLRGRELLKGKMMGFGLFFGLQSTILLVLLVALGQRDIAGLASGVLMMGSMLLLIGSLGQWASVWMPRPMPRNTLKSGTMPLPLALLSIGGTMLSSGLFCGAYALIAWLAPAFLLPAFVALFLLSLGLHHVFLEATSAYLERHRERLVENLG